MLKVFITLEHSFIKMIFSIKHLLLKVYLTHSETLQFGARLTQANEERATARVEQLVSEFELQRCLDILVGGQFKKGISGG
jgi:ABC-type Na+ transport system ATPase subunit NatA